MIWLARCTISSQQRDSRPTFWHEKVQLASKLGSWLTRTKAVYWERCSTVKILFFYYLLCRKCLTLQSPLLCSLEYLLDLLLILIPVYLLNILSCDCIKMHLQSYYFKDSFFPKLFQSGGSVMLIWPLPFSGLLIPNERVDWIAKCS